MRNLFLMFSTSLLVAAAAAGDWGKAPIDKIPVEECVDLGAGVSVGYQSDYVYKGLLVGGDTVLGDLHYVYEGLPLPVTFGATYANVIGQNEFANVFNDELTVTGSVGLPTFAGIHSAISYSHRFYPEDPNTAVWPSSHGEVGLHLSRDLQIVLMKFNLYRNFGLPNAWNGTIPTLANEESGAWYWDLGIERRFEFFGQGLVLAGGVAHADNYWGVAPALQTNRSSGWNHYYLSASLPIELNCRSVLTPYIGYVGAPEGWLMDGAPDWANRPAQSDLLHGGVNLSVSF